MSRLAHISFVAISSRRKLIWGEQQELERIVNSILKHNQGMLPAVTQEDSIHARPVPHANAYY